MSQRLAMTVPLTRALPADRRRPGRVLAQSRVSELTVRLCLGVSGHGCHDRVR